MRVYLNRTDLEFILGSLKATKRTFENYSYPSYELKLSRLEDVDRVIEKIRKAAGELRKSNHPTNREP